MKELTPEEAEALIPELFKIARQLRARGALVRIHSLRIGDIDENGRGGEKIVIKDGDGQEGH